MRKKKTLHQRLREELEKSLRSPELSENLEDQHEDLHDAELEKRSARQPLLNSVQGVNLEDAAHHHPIGMPTICSAMRNGDKTVGTSINCSTTWGSGTGGSDIDDELGHFVNLFGNRQIHPSNGVRHVVLVLHLRH